MAFWQDKSIVITGGGSGIGKALGAALAQRGAKVWLSDVNGASAADAATECAAVRHSSRIAMASRNCDGMSRWSGRSVDHDPPLAHAVTRRRAVVST